MRQYWFSDALNIICTQEKSINVAHIQEPRYKHWPIHQTYVISRMFQENVERKYILEHICWKIPTNNLIYIQLNSFSDYSSRWLWSPNLDIKWIIGFSEVPFLSLMMIFVPKTTIKNIGNSLRNSIQIHTSCSSITSAK